MNERYRLLKLNDYISQHYKHNPALIIVTPSDRGKTDTIRIFTDEIDTAMVLPPSSPTGLIDFFDEHQEATTIILDDPSNWSTPDFFVAVQFLKSLTTGFIDIPRKTKFQNVPKYAAEMATALFCNIDQYNAIRGTLKMTGFNTRALSVFTNHTKETGDYIFTVYEDLNGELPHFTKFEINTKRDLTREEREWINIHFQAHRRCTIKLYSKMLSREDFDGLKPFLLSYKTMQTVFENIKFREETK